MNTNNINSLLEKYWNVETSIEEENILKAYFSSDRVADEHLQYKPLFQVYSNLAQVKLEGIEVAIQKPKEKVFSLNWWKEAKVMGIAASLLILISVGVFNIIPSTETQYAGKYTEISEEEEALEVTMEALAYLGIKFEESSRTIKTNVNKMEITSIIK